MLLICGDESTAAAFAADESLMTAGCGGWSEEMERRGVLRDAGGLRPPTDATTVRVRDGDVLLSDGPFAETKEQMGGYCVIECADLDEAIGIASAHPAATYGMIEVRPIWVP